MAKKNKTAESRARYYIRQVSEKRGWNINHVSRGGDCLEENEIMAAFPDIGLGLSKPDFLFCLTGNPVFVIEAKNEAGKVNVALQEATEYADQINKAGKYSIKIAVGAAGEEQHGFHVKVAFLRRGSWVPLTSQSFEITTIPSKRETELALLTDNGTTSVTVPSSTEFIEAAIELSSILRFAKVEAPLRPKVIGAIVLAMYQGDVEVGGDALVSINSLIAEAIDESIDMSSLKKSRLADALRLTGGDYDRLNPTIGRITAILQRLNVRAVLQTDTDFLGLFYEAFLRYGYDNNALGIVFTPRHITNFCADLLGASMADRVIDVACGTGGFLVAAFDLMLASAHGPKAIAKVKQSVFGSDTNPTIWALATLNMFFRGDGKTHIENRSCFDSEAREENEQRFTRAFLNPPFSQTEEPERNFIDVSLEALEPGGLLAVVVKAGIFADDDNREWRERFTRNHRVSGVISLPEDLFYPTAAPTSILLAEAHIPQSADENIFLGRIWNDGFIKLKGKRVDAPGSQLPEIVQAFRDFKLKQNLTSDLIKVIPASQILGGNEWSPQQYLENILTPEQAFERYKTPAIIELYKATVTMPELAGEVIEDFLEPWKNLPPMPLGKTNPVNYFFDVLNGKSQGEKNYAEGVFPYVSSGDTTNSIIRLIAAEEDEIFEDGGITVTAFGQACLQPWSFAARGNGGSAVRILQPKFAMSFNELLWFVAQINSQRWRFFYGRMAIKSRLERLVITSPHAPLPDSGETVSTRLVKFYETLIELSNH
ncbi:MAG: SAM-dependent methyltransferase [Pyrinomonadaceae bacterium]|nr:SAM-dependent methyltransferase [Pyrinomonadaceae bacterium]